MLTMPVDLSQLAHYAYDAHGMDNHILLPQYSQDYYIYKNVV